MPAKPKPDGIVFSASERRGLYATRRFMRSELQQKLGLRIPFDVYFQDRVFARRYPDLEFDKDCYIPWEPNFGDGPTSARFAVVDYDAHTETLTPPAQWSVAANKFLAPETNAVLDRHNADVPQFHQVNVWAIAQRALDFFESGFALGRRIPWGFDGNRLILVPHAGPGRNAYYDRESHSLQFYYFDGDDGRVDTCLSTDIVSHEFGHAVLDGIRPYYNEAVLPETAAFHEFIGDLTAILSALRNNAFRAHLVAETEGELRRESSLSNLAEEFGKYVEGKPYLRSAKNDLTMPDVAGDQRPHYMSQVLTGAMFDIIVRLSEYYASKGRSNRQAFWETIQRMQNVAIQPLDLLPPVDVTFADYALAVLRADEIANPTDPDQYRGPMVEAFIGRGILREEDRASLLTPHHVFDRIELDVFHDVESIASSRADAYRFLDDNRRKLFIPANADLIVADLSTAQKLTRQARRLPKQILLQYIWREDVTLDGAEFGRFNGEVASMLCGATLAMNENGDVMAWARKPGSQATGKSKAAVEEQARGAARRAEFLAALAQRITTGRVGTPIGSEKGILARKTPPLTSRIVDGAVRFELTPHFGIHDDADDDQGGRSWQISS